MQIADTTNLQQALNALNTTSPAAPGWQPALQQVYQTYLPALSDFAQGIYTAWTAPAVPIGTRLTIEQLIRGLSSINTPSGGPAYDPQTVATAANAFFMEIVLVVDTQGLLAAAGQSSWTMSNAANYVSLSDNHPEADRGFNTSELDDEDLQPKMTIHWRPASMDGTTVVTLIAFQDRGDWVNFASQPQALPGATDGSWVAYALSALPPKQVTTYAFTFSVAGNSTVFWFDPYIGDKDDQ